MNKILQRVLIGYLALAALLIVLGGIHPQLAVRRAILLQGYPIQPFIVSVAKTNYHDPMYGDQYQANWWAWHDSTGMTGTIFYVKKGVLGYSSDFGNTGP